MESSVVACPHTLNQSLMWQGRGMQSLSHVYHGVELSWSEPGPRWSEVSCDGESSRATPLGTSSSAGPQHRDLRQSEWRQFSMRVIRDSTRHFLTRPQSTVNIIRRDLSILNKWVSLTSEDFSCIFPVHHGKLLFDLINDVVCKKLVASNSEVFFTCSATDGVALFVLSSLSYSLMLYQWWSETKVLQHIWTSLSWSCSQHSNRITYSQHSSWSSHLVQSLRIVDI